MFDKVKKLQDKLSILQADLEFCMKCWREEVARFEYEIQYRDAQIAELKRGKDKRKLCRAR